MTAAAPTHQLKNAKGLFVETITRGIASVAVVEHLRKEALPWVAKHGRANPEDYENALRALEALPQIVVPHPVSHPDPNFDETAYKEYKAALLLRRIFGNYRQTEDLLCYAWQSIGTAKGASSTLSATSRTSAKESGWLDISKVAKSVGLLNEMLAVVAIDPIVYPTLEGATTAAKKAKDLIFEKIDIDNRYANTESFLLFVPGKGYFDAKGAYGPLSRARGFETAESAARTAASRKLSQWKVAKAAMSVVLAVDLPGDSPSHEIAAAVALSESQSLQRALEAASIETLRDRLASLEASHGITHTFAKNKSRL